MPLTGDELTEVLAERFRANADSLNLDHMAAFCGIKHLSTVKLWLGDKHKPMGGLAGLKLWHFLAQVGIASPELGQVRENYPEAEYLGRLVAFGVLSLDEVCKMCRVQKDAILRAVRNQNRLLHCPTLEALKKEHSVALEAAVKNFQKLSRRVDVALARKKPVPDKQGATSSGELKDLQRRLNEILETLRIAVPVVTQQSTDEQPITFLAIRDVAEKLQVAAVAANVAISQFSPEQRDLLRVLMGPRAMFDLSNVLERLCTERAFNEGA